MSILRVDSIVNQTADGRPLLSIGASISAGYALTAANISIPGDLFATSFSGNGAGLTNLKTASSDKVLSIKLLGIWFDDYRF
jgi:hypothetical protein